MRIRPGEEDQRRIRLGEEEERRFRPGEEEGRRIRRGAADLTNFHRVFSRVLSSFTDPPLEAIWFFSALSFHDRPGDLRSLLQLLSAFAASSPSAAKPLALLGPVVSELYHSDKPRRETEALVEAVLSYISICSTRTSTDGAGAGADAGRLLPAFGELVKVWSVRHSRDEAAAGEVRRRGGRGGRRDRDEPVTGRQGLALA